MSYSQELIDAVRILVPDCEGIYGPNLDEFLFTDEEIGRLLTVGQGNAMWAAGLAMIAVGNSEAMVGKTIRNYETQTDASKLQREWRAAGSVLIKAGREEALSEDEGFFIVAYPPLEQGRHPEGYTHGSYRGIPGSYNW